MELKKLVENARVMIALDGVEKKVFHDEHAGERAEETPTDPNLDPAAVKVNEDMEKWSKEIKEQPIYGKKEEG